MTSSVNSNNISARDMLKMALISERRQFSPLGYWPVCPICQKPIYLSKNIPDMHEAIITRGMVSGNDEQNLIYTRYNCVLRHQVCPDGLGAHTPGIGSESDYKACVQQLIEFEGKDQVSLWLISLEKVFPTLIPNVLTRFWQAAIDIEKENDEHKNVL